MTAFAEPFAMRSGGVFDSDLEIYVVNTYVE
jgi:hypothetical protein